MAPIRPWILGMWCVAAMATAQPATDPLLESAAGVLDEAAAYHTPPVPREAPAVIELTLETCVARALARNVEALVAETEVALREAEAGQARSGRRPQVAAEAAYNYVEDLDFGIDGGFLGGFVDTESFSPEKETITTRLTVTQVLYAGGQIQAAVRASRHLAESEAWRRGAVRQEVAYLARQAYHDAIAARAAEQVAEEAEAAFARHLRDTEILAKEGALTDYEVMRARTEVAARAADVAAARAQVERADIGIRRVLGLPPGQPVQCGPAGQAPPAPAPGTDFGAIARAQRPEVHALRDALAAAEAQRRGVIGKYLPQASTTVTWVEVDGGGQSNPDGWQVNVGARWDLYMGGQRRHERAAARARAEGLRHELAELERGVAHDVDLALARLSEAQAAVRARRENAELAAESVRLADIRYREGIGTQTEIIDAELERARARSGLVFALRDYHVALAALERAAGGPWEAAGADLAAPVGAESAEE